jgi:aryl-alcohol dehydrogenase-like predicted oxidoreductase
VQVGVSNVRGPWVDRAMAPGPVVSLQNQYNLRQRVSDPDVDRCAEEDRAFMPWAPLAGAIGPDADGAVGRIAAEREVTPAQVTLAWLLARSPAMLVIPGTASVEHLEENVAAASLELSPEELDELTAMADGGA